MSVEPELHAEWRVDSLKTRMQTGKARNLNVFLYSRFSAHVEKHEADENDDQLGAAHFVSLSDVCE